MQCRQISPIVRMWQSLKTTFFAFCRQSLIWMSSAVNWSCSTFTRSNPAGGISHCAPATTAAPNCSSSLHGGWAFHLAVPGRRQGKLPQSCSCSGQPARGNCRQSILCCTLAPARRSGNWHSTCRNCGLADVSATTNCQASTLGKSGGRDFPKSAVCCERWPLRGVSNTVQGCCSLGRVGASHETEDSNVLARHSWANMLSRVASRLQPSSLIWTILTNLERCLKGRSAAQALNSSAYRVTSTISGRGPVRIANVEVNLMGTEITALLFHICPLCGLKLHMAPATTHTNWQRSFPQLCGAARSCHPNGAQ